MDHMRRKTLKLDKITMVVLDEADEMLNMGFEEDIETILKDIPEGRQTILFSATMNKRILEITKKYLKEPKNVKIKSKELTVDRIEQISLEVKQKMKDEIVMRLIDLNDPKKAVVFCNTKKKVDNLIEKLKNNGYKAECLHGDIKQAQRDRIMKRFKQGEFQILVATDVVARGIDVEELELVINYDIPQEEEYYVHRIGRTGRNGKIGKAYTFVVGKEKSKLLNIQKYANTKIIKGKIPTLEEINKVKNQKIVDNIEEMIEKARREVDATIKHDGERAVLEAGVHNIHPELVRLLGRLRYRTSYGQNVLNHSLEVSYLAGMMASELGMDPTIAKRAGLLHDIGKSIDHEVEGTHVQIGVDLARKYKEHDAVIHAIQAHHGDVEAKTVVACLVQAADALSAARPGARRENVENYIKRLEKLEEVASSFEGVESSYAIQAGREVRIMVKPEVINDERMLPLAREICKKIEEELEYPGQIKVNIIRESRAVNYAK